ncbi:hypothetical protein M569_09168 [Genlisea aurea]|uniref:RING-type E3 ubiquitin transferase n=1 Tax=Genlisea aurea TaxID=192259 RepID=S8CF97_9LAMI|nr:hypothetical protein M569_09168 [Genlisea aurea]
MLQIRLSKPASDAGGNTKLGSTESVNVACPDHLVLADLPVAKSLGTPFANAVVKNVGRRSRRQLGDRVHFCVQCDFPIAVYGRLTPCGHAFCLDCARSDSVCYLCEERIQKIQTIKMMEGIFICAAPHCLKSFLKKSEFEFHINERHSDLLHPGNGTESEVTSGRRPSASDSTVQTPSRSAFFPSSNSQSVEPHISRPGMLQPMPLQPPFPSQFPNHPYVQHSDGAGSMNFPLQNYGPSTGADSAASFSHCFLIFLWCVSVNPNLVATAPPHHQYGHAPYSSDGAQQYYGGAPYELSRPDSVSEAGPGHGSLSTFLPGSSGPNLNFAQKNHPQSWNMGPGPMGLEPPLSSQGTTGGGRSFVDPRDGKGGTFTPPPLPHHLMAPSIPPPHLVQPQQRGRSSYPGEPTYEASQAGFGWQPE